MWPKTGLVTEDLTNIEGTDFQEVYSLVSQYVSERLVVSVSVKQKHKRRLLIVKNAFVNVNLIELIYVSQPDGFLQVGKEDWVYVLMNTLYELLQSSRQWHLSLNNLLGAFGFVQSGEDSSVYVWTPGGRL